MSTQKFSAIEREAIWRAYSEKCVYSRGLLEISNFHIDHIIPEALLDDQAALKTALADCGLDDTFDVRGWENLVPCQPDKNLQKSSIVFDPHYARFYLGIASARKANVVEEIGRIEKARKRGRAVVQLEQLLEIGKLTHDEVAQILQQHLGDPDEIFELLEVMTGIDSTEVRIIARTEIEDLRDIPVNLIPDQGLDGVVLTGPNDEKRICRTCREYDAAMNEGYYAYTTFDIKMATRFEHRCGLLKALQVAKTPTQSFVNKPRVSVLDLNLMPYSFFPILTNHEADAETKSYQDLLDSGQLVVRRIRGNMLTIEEPEGMGQMLIEVTRADFNADGIEDILLFEYCYATHGTLGAGGIRIITRLTADAMFSTCNSSVCGS